MASRAVGRTDNFEWVNAEMTWGCEAQKQGLQCYRVDCNERRGFPEQPSHGTRYNAVCYSASRCSFQSAFRTGEAQPICDHDALPSRWWTSRSRLHKSCEGPVNSPERQFQPPEKAARGAGIDRARSGYRKHAARVLRSRHRIDAVGDVIGGGHIGPVEDILYFEEQHKPPEISVIDLPVVMDVEIDQTVGRRLQHIGVLHEEPILPDVLDEPSHALPGAIRLVVT